MNLFGVMDVSGSALSAERLRAEVVAANMANAETTQTPQGGPYRRQHVVFESEAPSFADAFADQGISEAAYTGNGAVGNGFSGAGFPGDDVFAEAEGNVGGVTIAAVVQDKANGLRRYDPQHPDADKDGYVSYPDINPLTEMVDLMSANRAYGLNSSAVQATKAMIGSSLDIMKA
ncbi:flagellar basal body rod protein FlgC [Silvibacterium dinghuense]|uniref:Flagellar basal-body rod protein FlgC n=1 Tax=Silvibacterium dinghuense TaxID=1560006 RepID=A0A4Q1SEH7_9BACT|nr:flagellar basal body rod protein FlgC [Silvibacterium dinghuense]RXS95672.1 flagellar basal body rod protein FlgC [Silvibacterium dinghuense]GGH14837.1 flagellar basal-body rod protein FlgC [Silvibacterium dinghuense]